MWAQIMDPLAAKATPLLRRGEISIPITLPEVLEVTCPGFICTPIKSLVAVLSVLELRRISDLPLEFKRSFSSVPEDREAIVAPIPAAAPVRLTPVATEPVEASTFKTGLVAPLAPTVSAEASAEVTVTVPELVKSAVPNEIGRAHV